MDEQNKENVRTFNTNYFTKDNFWDEASPSLKPKVLQKKGLLKRVEPNQSSYSSF